MVLPVLFEVQFSDVRKVILDEFVWRKGIRFIYINQNRVRFSRGSAIYLLGVEPLALSCIGFCVISCLLGEVVWLAHICGRL